MAVKTQWKNVAIFIGFSLGVVILIYRFTSKDKLNTSESSYDLEEVKRREKEIKREHKEKLENGMKVSSLGKPCCRRDENNLLGKFPLNPKLPTSLTELEKKLNFVQLGGHWKPVSCQSPVKVAVIIPYRNRQTELLVLLRTLHPMLSRQRLYYQIFVVEQSEDHAFNKGKLQNVGFTEALKYDDFDCFIFHDVDLIPEDDRNYYGCSLSPAHLSPSIDKFDYKIHSPDIFGGVAAFTKKDFSDVNGFSNSFYGVEGENENMLSRIHAHNKRLRTPVGDVGIYFMLQHKKRIEKKEKGHPQQRDPISHENEDGLKKLRYKILHNDKYNLFTFIKVDLLWDKKERDAF